MAGLVLITYFAVLGTLALLGIYRLILTARALTADSIPTPPLTTSPPVLVQLPIYNEAFVVERLLRAAAALRYPGELTIQVLDDSTDETSRVIDRVIAGIGDVDIQVVRRGDRAGYKAGALAHGLTLTTHPLVAIFDADFLPKANFLLETVPHLQAGVGLVQARWGHENRNRSWLTRAQAIFLDGHFAIEHRARHAFGAFFNFNGTAGVWRRQAIEEAGGWTADTITEDLDLSYRAQLAGWRFVYLDDVVAPAELPERWSAFRSQQARWVRGSVETARKHLGGLLFADLPLRVRVDAVIHLTNNFAYLFMAVLAILLPASVFLRDQLGWRVPGGQTLLSILDVTMLTSGTFAMVIFYAAAVARTDRITLGRLVELLFALCVGAGMSISNMKEVLAGLRSKGSVFVRTPKRGDAHQQQALVVYRSRSKFGLLFLETMFLVYFGAAVVYAVKWQLFGALPFLMLYTIGFLAVVGGHLKDSASARTESVAIPDPLAG